MPSEARKIDQAWRATYSGISCLCRVQGDETAVTVLFPRYTKLGRRMLVASVVDQNVRPVLANYLRQELGLPRGEANMTRVSFVGV